MSSDSSSPRRFSSVLPKVAGSTILTIVLMAIVEGVAGLVVEPRVAKEIAGDAVSRTVTYIEVNPAPLTRDVDLLWRNVPGARKTQPVNPRAYGTNDEWTIENNSRGYRGPEIETAKRDGTFRILSVGDSITFGFSVDQPDTYPEQLRLLLSRRYPDRSFEVINAGVPGWSYLQGLRFLELEGLDLNPDVVVIGHGTNDQLFIAKVTDEERFMRLANPLRRFFQNLAASAAETNTYRALTKNRPAPPDDEPSPGCKIQIEQQGRCRRMSVGQISAAVHEVAELASRNGVELLIANTDYVQTPAIEGVKDGVSRNDLPFIDLVDTFNRKRREDEEHRATRLGLAPDSGSPVARDASKEVVLRTLVPDKTLSYRVEGMGYFQPGLTISEPLFDDGTHGDERPGDGVFSVTLSIPASYVSIEYKYYQGETAEFAALPPLASTLGDRVLRTAGNRTGPVDVFGQSLFMVERAHPNRDGHELNAQLIADKLEELPAFREYVKGSSRGDRAAQSTDR